MKLISAAFLGIAGIWGAVVLGVFHYLANASDQGAPLPWWFSLAGVGLVVGCFVGAFRLFNSWRADRKEPSEPPK